MGARREEAGARAARPVRAQGLGYPEHWEADIALSDGSAAHLRPIRPSDADRLQRFHQAQSERSRYFRFFAPMPTLSPRDLERFTVVDHRDRVALIVLSGEDIVAVGRYDRISPDEAEVAFNVADEQQGRGLGSILLEHLAAAARERGIRTFVADVLPQNAAMLRVFTDAGFDVRRTLDDGVVAVEFGIDPTRRSLEVIAEREHRAEARAMERLLRPSALALIGVSAREDSPGGRVLRHLQDSGWSGAVHVVAREALEIRGVPTVARIADLPPGVDLAVIALRRAQACLEAVEECGRAGIGAVLVLTEEFADVDPDETAIGAASVRDRTDGAALQRRLVARARSYGMRVLGPGSFGFLRTGEDPLNLSLSPRLPAPGPVSLAAQSGALSAMLLAGADERGIGVREFVAVGNRADVSLNDTLQHFEDDEGSRVLAIALESMGNPRKFTRIARRLARERPIVVLRPPGVGITAPPGHDVRPSTLPRRALDQVLASSGIVAARDASHLLDIVDGLSRQGVPAGQRVGLLSTTAALGEALRGAADAAGLHVVQDNRRVPLGADERLVRRAFTSMAALGEVDLVIAAVLDPLSGDLVAALRPMAQIARGSGVALVTCVVSDHERMSALRETVRCDPGLPPVHPTPARAVGAASGMLAAARSAQTADAAAGDPPQGIAPQSAREIVQEALGGALTGATAPAGPEQRRPRPLGSHAAAGTGSGEGIVLDQERTAALLAAYGLDLQRSLPAATPEEAVAAAESLGYPVALKSSDPQLRHRADLGGVRLGLGDAEQVRAGVEQIRRDLRFSTADLEVQAMAPPGVGVLIRSSEDPSLGPVLAFSLADDAAGLLGDIAYAIPPLDHASALELLDAPVTAAKLRGGSGVPPADREGLADLLVRIARMAEDLPELAQLELRPVLAGRESCAILHARAVLAPAPNRTDSLRRTLPGGTAI